MKAPPLLRIDPRSLSAAVSTLLREMWDTNVGEKGFLLTRVRTLPSQYESCGCQNWRIRECPFNVKIYWHTRNANRPVQFPTCQQRSLRDCYKIHIPVEADFDPIHINLFSLESYLRIIAMLRRCQRWLHFCFPFDHPIVLMGWCDSSYFLIPHHFGFEILIQQVLDNRARRKWYRASTAAAIIWTCIILSNVLVSIAPYWPTEQK